MKKTPAQFYLQEQTHKKPKH